MLLTPQTIVYPAHDSAGIEVSESRNYVVPGLPVTPLHRPTAFLLQPVHPYVIPSRIQNAWDAKKPILTIYFGFNRWKLTGKDKAELFALPIGDYLVKGYASPPGSKWYNQKLALKRAESAAKFLRWFDSKAKAIGVGVPFGATCPAGVLPQNCLPKTREDKIVVYRLSSPLEPGHKSSAHWRISPAPEPQFSSEVSHNVVTHAVTHAVSSPVSHTMTHAVSRHVPSAGVSETKPAQPIKRKSVSIKKKETVSVKGDAMPTDSVKPLALAPVVTSIPMTAVHQTTGHHNTGKPDSNLLTGLSKDTAVWSSVTLKRGTLEDVGKQLEVSTGYTVTVKGPSMAARDMGLPWGKAVPSAVALHKLEKQPFLHVQVNAAEKTITITENLSE